MGGKLLDTNIIIKYFNKNKEIADILELIPYDDIFISVIVKGELIYGAEKSTRKNENMRILEDFFERYVVVDINSEIASEYGKVKNGLISLGINIPENDIWIAATAIRYGYELVSTDKHFESIEGLRLLKL